MKRYIKDFIPVLAIITPSLKVDVVARLEKIGGKGGDQQIHKQVDYLCQIMKGLNLSNYLRDYGNSSMGILYFDLQRSLLFGHVCI